MSRQSARQGEVTVMRHSPMWDREPPDAAIVTAAATSASVR
jgi:hypothetical protein